MKKLTAALLSIFIIAGLLISCGDNVETVSSVDTTSVTEAVETEKTDGLEARDFESATFNMATFELINFHYELDPEAENGDVLNDALYQRNRAVEEHYNVDLKQTLYPDFQPPRESIVAGDDEFNIIILRCPDAINWWGERLIYTYNDIPYIDLENSWWDQTLNDSLSLANHNYIAVGAFNLDIYDLTFCLLFNKNMTENYSIGDIYKSVKDGIWTYDLMAEYMKLVTADVNGDGKMTSEDSYGYTAQPKNTAPGFWIAAGVTSISKDEDDMPYISMTEEKFISVWDKIFQVVHDSNGSFFDEGAGGDIPTACRNLFAENRSLFIDMSYFFIESMRNMDSDFGIIPYPKYSESQTSYPARVCYYMPAVIPITNNDLEIVGYMLETLNFESEKAVIPAYYDVALKTKFTRDYESAEMLDLIFDSRVIDIGDSTLCATIRDNFIYTMMRTNKRDLVSTVEKQSANIMKYLDGIIPKD